MDTKRYPAKYTPEDFDLLSYTDKRELHEQCRSEIVLLLNVNYEYPYTSVSLRPCYITPTGKLEIFSWNDPKDGIRAYAQRGGSLDGWYAMKLESTNNFDDHDKMIECAKYLRRINKRFYAKLESMEVNPGDMDIKHFFCAVWYAFDCKGVIYNDELYTSKSGAVYQFIHAI